MRHTSSLLPVAHSHATEQRVHAGASPADSRQYGYAPRTRLRDRRAWIILTRVLDSPILRAMVAALAVYGVWQGSFIGIAHALAGNTGIPALIWGGALQGAVAGHLITGDLRGIAVGTLSGGAFGLVGDVSGGWTGGGKWLAKPLLQGLAGGACGALQGGTFRSGFIGAVAFGELALAADLAYLCRIGDWLW